MEVTYYTQAQLDDDVASILAQLKEASTNEATGSFTFVLLGKRIALSLSDDLFTWQVQISDFVNVNFEKTNKDGKTVYRFKDQQPNFSSFYKKVFNKLNEYKDYLNPSKLTKNKKGIRSYWRKDHSTHHWVTQFQFKFFEASFRANQIKTETYGTEFSIWLIKDEQSFQLTKKPIPIKRFNEIIYTLLVFGVIDVFSFINDFNDEEPINRFDITGQVQASNDQTYRATIMSNIKSNVKDVISISNDEANKNNLNLLYYTFTTLTNALIQEQHLKHVKENDLKTFDLKISQSFIIPIDEMDSTFYRDIFHLESETVLDKGDFYLNYLLYCFKKELNPEHTLTFTDYRLNRLTSDRMLEEFAKSPSSYQKLVSQMIYYKMIKSWSFINQEIKSFLKQSNRFSTLLYSYLEKLYSEPTEWLTYNEKIERQLSDIDFKLGIYSFDVKNTLDANIELTPQELVYARNHIDVHNFFVIKNFNGFNILPTELDVLTETDLNSYIVHLLNELPMFKYFIVVAKDTTLASVVNTSQF